MPNFWFPWKTIVRVNLNLSDFNPFAQCFHFIFQILESSISKTNFDGREKVIWFFFQEKKRRKKQHIQYLSFSYVMQTLRVRLGRYCDFQYCIGWIEMPYVWMSLNSVAQAWLCGSLKSPQRPRVREWSMFA